MGKQSKATKKFEKSKLSGTLERRKDFAKVKQRHKQKENRQRNAAKRAEKDEAQVSDSGAVDDQPDVEDMDRDEFFQDSVAIPEPVAKSSNKKRKRDEKPTKDDGSEGGSFDGEDEDADFKGQLDALAQKDPEFYKYLKENDAELLDFDEDADLAEVDALSDGEDERPSKKQKTATNTELDLATVRKWKKALEEQNSVRSLRQVVLAFRSAVAGDEEEEKGKDTKYKIPSSDVYHEVLITALDDVPKVLAHHLPVKESASGKIHISTNTPKFKTLSPLIKSHISSLHTLLNQLSDSTTLRKALASFEPLLAYLLQYRKFLKIIIRTISTIWSSTSSDEATRISAFLILRRLTVIGDPGLRETILKSTYESLVRGARSPTETTLPGINLMKNSAAELYGIDQKVSYTTAFKHIRQLAMHLRTHVAKPTKDSYKQIYNWQYVHSLDFWSRVLTTHCNALTEAQSGKSANESHLRPLIYPLVQITTATIRLIPTATYFPLRFHLIRSLLRISQSTGTYIPLASALLEVLSSPELRKPATNKQPSSTTPLKPLDFTTSLRAPTSYLKPAPTKIHSAFNSSSSSPSSSSSGQSP
ncbi:Nucleolar complex protein 2 [Cyphellophora attinorum]|uniref:Nucleolar complex protein 2 n=1 Tax=Cyphellophora attinorum TaxID=1664694 RepID=A0A0N1H897_9EURO|nr:Nucleolar complex protein 2 [Phialophora attinorum]KPI43093.1 Nucleolar complex protein 2 [Phialophora attinorum]